MAFRSADFALSFSMVMMVTSFRDKNQPPTVKKGLSQWQRQWESSETGRSLFRYKPHVTDRSQIDFPNTISYRNISKLRCTFHLLTGNKNVNTK